MIMLSARDWRDAVENGDVDAIVIPCASSYYNANLLSDRSPEALERLLPPSAVWTAEMYTKVTSRSQAVNMVIDAFGRITPAYLCSNVLSDRMIKPSYNIEGIANDRARTLPPVVAVTVCNMLELPQDKFKMAGTHLQTSATTWLYEAASSQISNVLREAIARGVAAVKGNPDLTTHGEGINIGIAPLFNEVGYRPLAVSRRESFKFDDTRVYTNRMMDLLGRYTYPNYITVFYNKVEV